MWHSNFLSPFTKRYLKTLFHSELYKHTNKYIFCDIKILFYGCESFFWALIEIKISLTDVLTYFVIKYQYETCQDMTKYPYSVTMTNMRFDEKTSQKQL